MISLGLAAYRGATTLAGAASPLLRGFGGRGSAWRQAFTGATADVEAAAGSVWVHAASMGEVVAARAWVQALLGAGQRAPILLTTRTARGLNRARAELGDRVVARVAPLDLPQLLRSFLHAAAPWRLDVIETEIWPQLIAESRRRGVAVVFVSATVSERTRAGLVRWGISGPSLFGEGVWVLAQSERHAERFRSLGVPSERIAVTGDLKAEAPVETASRDVTSRPAVVFGSLRPGEETMVPLLHNMVLSQGRVLVVAPRHEEGTVRVLGSLEREGIPSVVRRERGSSLSDWIEGLGPRVGVLATQGELPLAYESAAVAIVGGTFAPYGGHNALEPAARGCAIIVGPHTEAIQESVELLRRESAIATAEDGAEAAAMVVLLLRSTKILPEASQGSLRAATEASQAVGRSLEALDRFGLAP